MKKISEMMEICYNTNRIAKPIRFFNYRDFSGVAVLSPIFDSVETDIENKMFIITFQPYIVREDIKKYYLPMDDKELMGEFFEWFKEKLELDKDQFNLLINL